MKAVQLIKALVVDENHKRDILAKVNFNKDLKEVYQDTKTAIRDICGDLDNNGDTARDNKPDDILMVKPWQEKDRRNFSRSRSRESGRHGREGRSRDRGGFRSYSHDSRSRSRDRSDSRGRSRGRSTVSFQERSRRDTPVRDSSGMSTEIVVTSKEYDKVIFSVISFFILSNLSA